TDDLTVEIDMPSACEVTMQIVDLEGRKCLEINELCVVGKNIFRFDLRGLSNGLYLLQLSSSTETSTRKIEVSR
ncbi:MAG TPA: T9SS type A sorting domain-containing protein, partial [Chitinophagales bacterium]|nr:T9SS type A sorting domain-containing protein [Chitinophagales bacterium]